MRPTLTIEATDGAARTGTLTTARGTVTTPFFMPVGTKGSVRALSTADLEALGAEVMLANTYHLMARPSAEAVQRLGGFHRFASWSGHVLTDSGGFQVFSLQPKVDDDGVTFRSTYDGTQQRLTPELAVHAQELIGADIQMVLDVCPPLPSPSPALRLAVERTAAWAERAKHAHTRTADQSLFGIVQGGTDPLLRKESAQRTANLDFDGYGIGGLSVGEPREEMLPALAAAIDELPADRPRYLMGVGDAIGLVEAIALGVDMFDCVLPTRLARHGSVLTRDGRLQIRNARYAEDDAPLDESCACMTCGRYSRAYLRHLLRVGEPSALRLLSWHNVAWTLALLDEVRGAIRTGTLARIRAEVSARWNRH